MLPERFQLRRSETLDLTDKQRAIASYILRQWSRGCPPTNRMIGFNFDISSPNGVLCHIQALQKKGYVQGDRYGLACVAPTQHAINLAWEELVKAQKGRRASAQAES